MLLWMMGSKNSMQKYQHDFIEFALRNNALLFGEFKLNSGRISPYFFNAGCFNTGAVIAELGRFYAAAIVQSGLEFDVLFGPAYKGIPLVTTVAVALSEHHGINKPFAFNRKEPKDHGEGGMIVGAALKGRVLVIDDVITRGITIGKVVEMIKQEGAEVAGIAILVDRQERGQGTLSAVQEVEQEYHLPVIRVVELTHVLNYLASKGETNRLAEMQRYREVYGV